MRLLFSDYVLGAAAATSLVNTSPQVRRSAGELLTDPAALGGFLAEHEWPLEGLASVRQPSAQDLAEVLALRKRVRELLEGTEEAVVGEANLLIQRSGAVPALVWDGASQWQWLLTTPAHASLESEVAALVGVGVAGAVRALSYSRIRHCASPECDGMFLDTSKAGRRRYCTPEICGNRLHVARHRARQRRGNTAPTEGGVPGPRDQGA